MPAVAGRPREGTDETSASSSMGWTCKDGSSNIGGIVAHFRASASTTCFRPLATPRPSFRLRRSGPATDELAAPVSAEPTG